MKTLQLLLHNKTIKDSYGILKITPHDVIGQQVTDFGVPDIDTLENCQCHVVDHGRVLAIHRRKF